MTDPNLPPVTPPSGQQPPAPPYQPPAAPSAPPAYQQPAAAPAYQQPAAAPAYQQQQPAYGQQQPYGAPTEKYNVLAIVSLVTGILGISLVAIITGHIGLSQIARTQEKGRGLAIAGLVLGYAGIVIGILLFFIVFIPLMSYIGNNPSVLNG